MDKTPDLNLKAEIARVQAELTCFREACLPALLGGSAAEFLHDGMTDFLKNHIVAVAGRLSQWQQTAQRLADWLPLGPLPPDAPLPDRKDFGRFLFQEATPAFLVLEGRIVWRIGLFVILEWALCCPVFEDDSAAERDEWERFQGRIEKVKRWLMGLPVDDSSLANALCVLLPYVADVNPPFAGLALDRTTWQALAQSDPNLEEEQRARRLKFLDSDWFTHILNNALLHVLGSLANNHFLEIRDFLGHECLRGSYTHLMPHYLFAVLFEKVRILRRLAWERGEW